MIPVLDSPRARTVPVVNLGLIVANVAVFLYELTLSADQLQAFFLDWGVVPARLTSWVEGPTGWEAPASVLTSMFIHGGWLHLLGNMLFLWVFGDNVEDAMGHVCYLLFYLLAGVGAAALQVFVDQQGVVPMVGASGAISGVLAGYLVMFPGAIVGVVVPFFWFFGPLPVPAAFLIVFWFIVQLFNGLVSLGVQTVETGGGIAFFAHVGGFLTGLLLAFLLRPWRRRRYRPY